jgi:hypothetical protein
MSDEIPEEILVLCNQVTAKRARTVIDHIIKYGFITTEDLKNIYGYDHPPRAIRDVREHGIPLKTFKAISSTTGRKIAAYKFDDPSKIRSGRIGGRIAFSKAFKEKLIEKYESRCTLTREKLDPRYLQIDHRIPYEIAGNNANLANLDEFMLLDASSQRAKSWSCENCQNFQELRNPLICSQCFWAFPEAYTHVAMSDERRVYLVWQGQEVVEYDQVAKTAADIDISVNEYIKSIIRKFALDT